MVTLEDGYGIVGGVSEPGQDHVGANKEDGGWRLYPEDVDSDGALTVTVKDLRVRVKFSAPEAVKGASLVEIEFDYSTSQPVEKVTPLQAEADGSYLIERNPGNETISLLVTMAEDYDIMLQGPQEETVGCNWRGSDCVLYLEDKDGDGTVTVPLRKLIGFTLHIDGPAAEAGLTLTGKWNRYEGVQLTNGMTLYSASDESVMCVYSVADGYGFAADTREVYQGYASTEDNEGNIERFLVLHLSDSNRDGSVTVTVKKLTAVRLNVTGAAQMVTISDPRNGDAVITSGSTIYTDCDYDVTIAPNAAGHYILQTQESGLLINRGYNGTGAEATWIRADERWCTRRGITELTLQVVPSPTAVLVIDDPDNTHAAFVDENGGSVNTGDSVYVTESYYDSVSYGTAGLPDNYGLSGEALMMDDGVLFYDEDGDGYVHVTVEAAHELHYEDPADAIDFGDYNSLPEGESLFTGNVIYFRVNAEHRVSWTNAVLAPNEMVFDGDGIEYYYDQWSDTIWAEYRLLYTGGGDLVVTVDAAESEPDVKLIPVQYTGQTGKDVLKAAPNKILDGYGEFITVVLAEGYTPVVSGGSVKVFGPAPVADAEGGWGDYNYSLGEPERMSAFTPGMIYQIAAADGAGQITVDVAAQPTGCELVVRQGDASLLQTAWPSGVEPAYHYLPQTAPVAAGPISGISYLLLPNGYEPAAESGCTVTLEDEYENIIWAEPGQPIYRLYKLVPTAPEAVISIQECEPVLLIHKIETDDGSISRDDIILIVNSATGEDFESEYVVIDPNNWNAWMEVGYTFDINGAEIESFDYSSPGAIYANAPADGDVSGRLYKLTLLESGEGSKKDENGIPLVVFTCRKGDPSLEMEVPDEIEPHADVPVAKVGVPDKAAAEEQMLDTVSSLISDENGAITAAGQKIKDAMKAEKVVKTELSMVKKDESAVPSGEKEAIQQAVKDTGIDAANAQVVYVDATISVTAADKKAGTDEPDESTRVPVTDITETNTPVELAIALPAETAENAVLQVVRYHDGQADIISDVRRSGNVLYFTSTKFSTFAVVSLPRELANLTVEAIPNQKYTGAQIKPSIVIKDTGTVLVEGTDYEIVGYGDNIEVGQGTVTIKAKAGGLYTGERTITFNIVCAEHQFTVAGDVILPPTCVAEGRQEYKCATPGCVQTVEKTLPATGEHTWNDGEVTKAPTETEKGVKTFTCTVCGETRTEEIEATGTPSTDAPSTDAPSTDAPSTDTPSTDAPSTDAPSTDAPSTGTPSTDAPHATDKPAGTAKPVGTSAPGDVPATGDETPLALYVGLLALCAAGLALVLGRKKRTEK